MVVAIIGASEDPTKFGNKAVRAYLQRGYDVYPINLRERQIEGLRAYRSVLDVPVEIDRVSIYLPPEKTLEVLADIAQKGTRELFLNPGSESDAVIARATELGLEPIVACSIVDIGESSSRY